MPFRFSGLFLALLLPVIAQETKPEKAAGAALQVRFLAEQAPETLGKVFLAFAKANSPSFALPTNHLSEPVITAGRVMVLKTVEKEIPLCTVTLPDEGKSFAVVLVTAKPAGYNAIIVRTDDPTFKAGDVFFINHSEKTVLGKLGETPLVLKPGGTSKTRPSGAREEAYYDIAFATRDEEGDKIISSSRWPIDNQLRSYIFFFTNAQGRTTFRAVDEYLTPPATGKP